MTPAMLDALLQRYQRHKQDQELLFGLLTATVVNHGMFPPKKPATAAEFMPSEILKKRNRKLTRQERAAQRAALEAQGMAIVKALMQDQTGKVHVE